MGTQSAFETSEERAMARATAVARPTSERHQGHRRSIVATPDRLEHAVRYDAVPAGEAVLVLGGRRPQLPDRDGVRTFEATLRFPGRLGPRRAVELDVLHHGDLHASLELRPVGTAPRRLSPERFERAALAALWALDHLLPWQEAMGTPLSLEVALELLDQSGAVAPVTATVGHGLEALAARVVGDESEVERVA